MKDKIQIELLCVIESVTTWQSPYGKKKAKLEATLIDNQGAELNIEIPIAKCPDLLDMKTARYRAILTLEPVPASEDFIFTNDFPQSSD